MPIRAAERQAADAALWGSRLNAMGKWPPGCVDRLACSRVSAAPVPARVERGDCSHHHSPPEMRVIFVPSSVRLYISPLLSKMKPTMGLTILSVSIEPRDPTVVSAPEPPSPT